MKSIILSLLTLLVFTTGSAQQFTVGLNGMAGNPQGEFEKATGNKLMWGGSIEGFAGLGWANAGLNIGYLYRGGESFQRSLGGPQGVPVNADVDITNQALLIHLVGRLQYPEGMFRPYVEGFIGGTFFSTVTSVKDRNKNEEIISDTNQDDLTFSSGYGAGILFQVWKDEGNSMQLPKPGAIFVDLKVKNTFGNSAEYLNKASDIYFDNNTSSWTTNNTQSETDFISWHIGVSVIF